MHALSTTYFPKNVRTCQSSDTFDSEEAKEFVRQHMRQGRCKVETYKNTSHKNSLSTQWKVKFHYDARVSFLIMLN